MATRKWFNDQVKDLLQEKNLSIKMVCDQTGFNYNRLLRLMKGEMRFTQEDLGVFLSCPSFDGEDVACIHKWASQLNLNQEERVSVKEVEALLIHMYETVIEKAVLKEHLLGGLESPLSLLSNQVSDQLYKSYTSVLKDTFLSGSAEFEIVLYLPPIPVLIHEIYHTIRALKACLDKRISLNITCLIERKGPSGDREAWNRYHEAIQYIKMATLTDDVTMKAIEPIQEDIQYGIYFRDRFIVIDQDDFQVTVLHQDGMTGLKQDRLDLIPLVETQKLNRGTDEFFVRAKSQLAYRGRHYSIMNNLNPGFVGDHYLRVSPKDYPSMAAYVHAFNQALENNPSGSNYFICESGIEILLVEGIMPDYSVGFSPLNELERVAIVLDTLLKMKKGCKLRLLPKGIKMSYPEIGIIQYYEVHKIHERILLKSHKKSNELTQKHIQSARDHNVEFIIKESRAVEAFDLYCRSVLLHITLSEADSFKTIQEMVLKHYGASPDPAIQELLVVIKHLTYKNEQP